MLGRRGTRWLALLAALIMIASACGSSSTSTSTEGTDDTTEKAGEDTETTEAMADEDEATDTTEAMADGDEAEGSTADGAAGVGGIQADSDAQIALIAENGWGVDDNNVLVGPSGFTVDLNECPDDWSETQGITDDSILLGQSLPQSGSVAIYGSWNAGMQNYFDYVNEAEGGVNGRSVTLKGIDDAYEAARSVSNVGELLEKDQVFAIMALVGTPATLATYDQLNEGCLPNAFGGTGHPAFGDPVEHPWTVPSAVWMPYSTEGFLWGQYIDSVVEDGPADIAILAGDNDAGIAWTDGVEEYKAANPDGIGEITIEKFATDAATVSNEITTLAATEADAFILGFGGAYCPQVMDLIAEAAWDPVVKAVPSVCSSLAGAFVPAGDNAEGWVVLLNGKDVNDSQWDGDEFVELARKNLDAGGIDSTTGLYSNAYENAWPTIEALRVADGLPGGLTRSNLILALRSMNREHPMKLPGVTFSVDGNADAYYLEAGQFNQYTLKEGEEVGFFTPVGELFDVNGETPNCVWDGNACS